VTPGTILFDSSFVFKDKQVGEKLIVVLNDGTDGYYILVKTTSVPDNKEKKIGCNLTNKKYPNFFIEKKNLRASQRYMGCIIRILPILD
jgi:hypothetical protein